ncbi:rhodanese-like domain-containing protein [Photobacterium halotolerans]|uniref:Rhodanese-like domain-containing protein n=1 Tax=Photobacterium halotolerans TaxID=265726 RepID=A0A7X4WF38_9GAMM|nr:rhodanese-like domain-containing protein [Photobacterium halotolerans]NAW67493.1 rhodanese-like domain-containing protein [Photobacterium halotolerans]NAW86434.1 rhodanese-like domain-containing protein [Photobacterium halotolerans]NAX46699.1 rhodanese-like domain-containing protein [Photobacterium halotolerans]
MLVNGRDLANRAKQSIEEIHCHELALLLTQEIILIDVRERHEVDTGMLPGAIHIARGVLEMQLDTHPAVAHHSNPLEVMAQQPVYLYCRSGVRSALAAESLQKMGFTRVFSLAGGIQAWQDAKLPVVNAKAQ